MPPAAPLRMVVADDSVLLREGLVRVSSRRATRSSVPTATPTACSPRSSGPRPTWRCSTCGCRRPSATRACAPRSSCVRRHPSTGILLLSQYVEGAYAQELLGSGGGGVGYLLKDRVASLEELEDAVRPVADGGTVLDPEVVPS